jgi:ABC-type polysaccharide/polyol phosphate transport system ATPase subunit
MDNKIAVKLTDVSKYFYLHSDRPTLGEQLNPFQRPTKFWALRGVNLIIKRGERFGLIGPNGAGKTTLLKIISGITRASSGQVKTSGRIVSLIELSAGFHPEMTARENVILNGLILGMTNKEISGKLRDILNFADIGKFENQPLYTYSSGMVLRLAVATLLTTDPDVLILDESLAVGDKEFVGKVNQELDRKLRKNMTVIIASHQEEFLKRFCDKLVELDKGKIVEKRPLRSWELVDEKSFIILRQILKRRGIIEMTINGISMLPNLGPNQKVKVKAAEISKIKPGEVVAYYSKYSRQITIHRVVKAEKMNSRWTLKTKGDNQLFGDSDKIDETVFLGRVELALIK